MESGGVVAGSIGCGAPAGRIVLRQGHRGPSCGGVALVAGESFYGTFYRLLGDTGLRPEETCGLRWSDVDFVRGTISVQRAVTRDGAGQAIVAEPKTVKSPRTIPMLGRLREELLRQIRQTADTYMHGDQAATADWMERLEHARDVAGKPTTPPN